MSAQDDSWLIKFKFLIGQMEKLIAKKGKKMVLYNVNAMRNPKKQYEKYLKTCEQVKNQYEAVVSTSLPGEERIFWPSQDVQFHIRDGDEKIHMTGNSKMIQKIINISDKPINTDVPEMDFWKYDKINYHLDSFRYVDESKLFDKDYKLNLPELIEKYKYQETQEFENKEYWYLLKFLFIGSYFQNLEGFGDLMGGVPKGLKIKCDCGKILDQRWRLKGIFEFPEYNHKHQYYLSLSELCENCGTIMCVYSDRNLDINNYFPPMRIFMNFLSPDWNYKITNLDMVAGWQAIFKISASKDINRFEQLYPQDIVKFGTFISEMSKKYNER